MIEKEVTIIGAGLAGCEAALTLANFGHHVRLYEQKPINYTKANCFELIIKNKDGITRIQTGTTEELKTLRPVHIEGCVPELQSIRYINANTLAGFNGADIYLITINGDSYKYRKLSTSIECDNLILGEDNDKSRLQDENAFLLLNEFNVVNGD